MRAEESPPLGLSMISMRESRAAYSCRIASELSGEPSLDDLNILHRLVHDGIQALPKILFGFVNGNDDGYFGLYGHCYLVEVLKLPLNCLIDLLIFRQIFLNRRMGRKQERNFL